MSAGAYVTIVGAIALGAGIGIVAGVIRHEREVRRREFESDLRRIRAAIAKMDHPKTRRTKSDEL